MVLPGSAKLCTSLCGHEDWLLECFFICLFLICLGLFLCISSAFISFVFRAFCSLLSVLRWSS